MLEASEGKQRTCRLQRMLPLLYLDMFATFCNMFPDVSWPCRDRSMRWRDATDTTTTWVVLESLGWVGQFNQFVQFSHAPMFQMAGPKRGFTQVWLRGLPGAQCSPWKTLKNYPFFRFSALTRRAHGKAGVYKMMAAMGPYVLLSAWQLRSSRCWHHLKTMLGPLRFDEPAPHAEWESDATSPLRTHFNLDVHARHKPWNFEKASLRLSSPSSQSLLKKSTVWAFRNLHVDLTVYDFVFYCFLFFIIIYMDSYRLL